MIQVTARLISVGLAFCIPHIIVRLFALRYNSANFCLANFCFHHFSQRLKKLVGKETFWKISWKGNQKKLSRKFFENQSLKLSFQKYRKAFRTLLQQLQWRPSISALQHHSAAAGFVGSNVRFGPLPQFCSFWTVLF